ncbi:MAG: alkaline phosphatase family protein [Hyalangium sp.]|uniref:alkaline phosphatase family protein n=1 Tax=Hyalangium sp. TaxID=2028555 RepID=UPI00389A05F1
MTVPVSLRRFTCLTLATASLGVLSCGDDETPQQGLKKKINHVVVIFEENRSFDNMYGEFPGANGQSNAVNAPKQIDASGQPYAVLPQPMDTTPNPDVLDPRFPADLPNAPFNIDQYVPANQPTGDLVHRWYQEQQQIDGGKMDKFALVSDAKGLTMGYYHTEGLPMAEEAKKYTLADNFFHSAFGGSFLNHIWLIAAATPVFPSAPAAMVAQLDANGNLVKDGAVTPDGYVVNTAFTVNVPHPSTAPVDQLVPNQTLPTIGDRLTTAGQSWAWYSGGWNDAIAGHPDPKFQFHHQPFAYFQNYADNTLGRTEHLKDEQDFLNAAYGGELPAVSFVKPIGELNEHPGYANVIAGEQHVIDLINAVRSGPQWQDTAIIITYDENGGLWDHVAPPTTDKWGPGSRIPAIIISPYARKGFVDHTSYDTTSILAFIEHRWDLEPLSTRDASVNDLTAAFDFDQKP